MLLSYAAMRSDGATWSVDYLTDERGVVFAGVYASSDTSAAVPFLAVTTDRGDVRELVDTQGAAFCHYAYDAYGSPTETTSTATSLLPAPVASAITERNILRYAGYAFDDFSGLYYCSQRYYDPETVSFVSKDPAKADGEESAYQYCGGDPVGRVDPSGEFAALVAPLVGNPALSENLARAGQWVANAGLVALSSIAAYLSASALARSLRAVYTPGAWSYNAHAAAHVGRYAMSQILRNARLWTETRLSPVRFPKANGRRSLDSRVRVMIVSKLPPGISPSHGRSRIVVIAAPLEKRVITGFFESSPRIERLKKRDRYWIQLKPKKALQWRYRPDPL